MASEFKIGTDNTVYDFLPLDQVLNTSQAIDPDWSFQPFTVAVDLGDGQVQGHGSPIVKWRWNGISEQNRQTLRDLIGTGLSGSVYIRTATNEIDLCGNRVYQAYSAIMKWPTTDEDVQTDKHLGLVLTFTHLEEVVE